LLVTKGFAKWLKRTNGLKLIMASSTELMQRITVLKRVLPKEMNTHTQSKGLRDSALVPCYDNLIWDMQGNGCQWVPTTQATQQHLEVQLCCGACGIMTISQCKEAHIDILE